MLQQEVSQVKMGPPASFSVHDLVASPIDAIHVDGLV
jgi:hypothetical protein